MKTIILAGGKGSRLSDYTYRIPKPMVTIGEIPIIEHIMNYFSYFDFFRVQSHTTTSFY